MSYTVQGCILLIMITALGDNEGVVGDFVYQPVSAVDTSGPITGPVVFQGLRIADTVKRVPSRLFNQTIDAFDNLLISLLPIKIILPCVLCPCDDHYSLKSCLA